MVDNGLCTRYLLFVSLNAFFVIKICHLSLGWDLVVEGYKISPIDWLIGANLISDQRCPMILQSSECRFWLNQTEIWIFVSEAINICKIYFRCKFNAVHTWISLRENFIYLIKKHNFIKD